MRFAFMVVLLMLSGCTLTKKIGRMIADPGIQVGELKQQPSEVTITFLTEPDSNLNSEDEPAPVDVQMVWLSDDSKFLAADYDLLATTPLPDALGKNYLDHQDFTLLPDILKTSPAIKLEAQTNFIGIVVYFSDDQTSEWKQIVPVVDTGHRYRLLVHVRRNSIEIKTEDY